MPAAIRRIAYHPFAARRQQAHVCQGTRSKSWLFPDRLSSSASWRCAGRCLVIKATLSGIIVAAVSEIARRSPGFGALVASLPLVSTLGMLWLWRDTSDALRLADHAEATFWYVLPGLPMVLRMPALIRRGIYFWPALAIGCGMTIVLYFTTTSIGPRFGLKL